MCPLENADGRESFDPRGQDAEYMRTGLLKPLSNDQKRSSGSNEERLSLRLESGVEFARRVDLGVRSDAQAINPLWTLKLT